MTVDDVKTAIARIRDVADDDERAHALEDDLRRDVLQAIAAGAENAPQLARLALTTIDIEFARWCA